MSCEEVDDLLAAYSLSALSAEETRDVHQHLVGCRRHDEALAELRAVGERLPLAAEEREPPPQLRTRLLHAFDAEVARRSAPRAGVVTPLRRWLPGTRPAFAYLAAAAVLVLTVIGLSAWNLTLQLDDEGDATFAVQLTGAAGTGELVYFEEDKVGLLKLELPEPPSARVYQAWGIYESGPVSLGLVPSKGVAAFDADLSDASAVAITEEPEGGSEQPTTQPLVLAELADLG